ncbi:MAG: glycosyltransferase family 4 protein [Pseudomonadota bacterium]|nr:glycosyltransferase family 4 protein [Pseudomonadota bacterium]
MRLLQLVTAFRPGGIQRHVLGLTASLREVGHHVVLAGTPGPWLNESLDAAFFPLDLVGVAKEGGTVPRRLRNAVKAALRLRAILRRERIELIHAHESAPALVAGIATIGLSTPTLVTYHGSEPDRVAAFGRIACLAARCVITPSHRSAADLRYIGGVPPSKLRVIGLGVEARPSIDEAVVQRLRRQLLGEGGRRLVVTVARLAHQKAPDVLIEVAKRTIARDDSIRFAIVGYGPLREDVRRWVAEAGVGRYVTLAGYSDRPHEFLAAADLFLLPSRWEGLPITIVEAFRAGLPVVATDAGGVRELVDDAVGKVVAIGDVDALTQQVLAICEDDALRACLAASALARGGEQRFSPSHVHRIFECTYAEMLGETLPPEGRN